MGDRSMSRLGGIGLTLAIALGLAGGLVRAGQSGFEKQRSDLQSQWNAEQEKQGLKDRASLFAKYPTPEIALFDPVVVQPGAAAPFSMRGKFASGTAFLAENDGAQLTGSLSSGAYAGKIVVEPDRFPGFVRVWAFTPVSGASNAAPVAFINSVLGFALQSPNGWTIRATPTAKTFTVTKNDATLPYRVEFYRANEAKPFQVLESRLRLGINDGLEEPLSFALQEQTGSAQAEMEALTAKMSDPQAFLKMSEAEQTAFFEKLQVLQEHMMKELTTQMKVDPAVRQKQMDDFGCSSIYVSPAGPGKVTAMVRCGRNVGTQGTLNTTGTSTPVR